jgi:hypothetical protein
VKVNIFDPMGLQVMGDFEVSADAVEPALLEDIQDGLQASRSGAQLEQSCCQVDGGAPQPKAAPEPAPAPPPKPEAKPAVKAELPAVKPAPEPKPKPPLVLQTEAGNRAPAIAPGTHIVYAPEREDETKPESAKTLLALPSQAPRPTLRPASQSRLSAQETAPRAPASDGSLCGAFQRFRARGVPEAPLRQALYFFSRAREAGKVAKSSRYLAIADYSQNSSQRRFYVLDLKNLTVEREKVSHGSGLRRLGYPGDPNHDGMINRCSTRAGDDMTRAGFFRVGDYSTSFNHLYRWPLISRHPPKNDMLLTGLSPGVNTNAAASGLLLHEATYNGNGDQQMGRSHGCFAFAPKRGRMVMDKLGGGSLLYSYAPVCASDMHKVLRQIPDWQSFCRY